MPTSASLASAVPTSILARASMLRMSVLQGSSGGGGAVGASARNATFGAWSTMRRRLPARDAAVACRQLGLGRPLRWKGSASQTPRAASDSYDDGGSLSSVMSSGVALAELARSTVSPSPLTHSHPLTLSPSHPLTLSPSLSPSLTLSPLSPSPTSHPLTLSPSHPHPLPLTLTISLTLCITSPSRSASPRASRAARPYSSRTCSAVVRGLPDGLCLLWLGKVGLPWSAAPSPAAAAATPPPPNSRLQDGCTAARTFT